MANLPEGQFRDTLEGWLDHYHTHPIDAKQMDLTKRILVPGIDEVSEELAVVRRDIDRVVKKTCGRRCDRKKRLRQDIPHTTVTMSCYPVGHCFWIRDRVWEDVNAQLTDPTRPGMRVLNRFVKKGGIFRKVSGVQHGKYFQNGLQAGAYWLDVANDTVDVNRPPVECKWMVESGFEDVDNLETCGEVIESYWESEVYPNKIFPYLAPIYPVIVVYSDGRVELLPLAQATVAVNVLSGLKNSEDFLFYSKFSNRELPAEFNDLIAENWSQTEDDGREISMKGGVFLDGGATSEKLREIFDEYRVGLEKNGMQLLSRAEASLWRFNHMRLGEKD